jgi:hypothetical protein
MYQPAHLDGCSLVVLRQRPRLVSAAFEIIESGLLSYDGETLVLVSDRDQSRREFSQAEQDRIKVVCESNQIAECDGYRFFLLELVAD